MLCFWRFSYYVARGAVSEINLSDEDRAAVRARLENMRVAVVQVGF